MTYSDIPRLLSMTLVWLVMLAWQVFAYQSNCAVTLAVLLFFTLLLFLSGTEIALCQRRIVLHECVQPLGHLFRRLQRRHLLLAVEFLQAAGLALFLLVNVLSFSARHWSLLFADILLISLLLPRFYLGLNGQLREEYRFTTSRRWAMWVSTLLLWLESLIVLFFSGSQEFAGLRWQEVVSFGTPGPTLQCGPLAAVAGLVDIVDGLGQWSVQNLARNFRDLPQALMASISLLVSAGLSLLLAYAYSRALIGAVARPWVMWRLAPRTDD